MTTMTDRRDPLLMCVLFWSLLLVTMDCVADAKLTFRRLMSTTVDLPHR